MYPPPHNTYTGVNGSDDPHVSQTNRGRSATTPSESHGDGDAGGGVGECKVASVDGSHGLDACGLGQRFNCTPRMYPPPLDASGLGQRFKCTDLSLSAGIYIFSKVLDLVTLCSEYSRALTFANLWHKLGHELI